MPKAQQDTITGKLFQVQDLTAGVNLRPTPTTIKPNQALYLQNTLIANVGELGVYPGWTAFSTTSLGNRRAQGGRRVYLLNGTTFTLAADNGNVYKPSDVGVWGSAVLTGLNTTNNVDFVHDRLLVTALDGSTTPQKSLDGSTWTQLGITAPLAAPTVAGAAGGSLVATDTYEFTYTYLNTTLNEESNESPVGSTAPGGGNGTINVTVVASADSQVGSIKLYSRDLTAGESTRRLNQTVTNTNQVISITTNNWTSNAASPTIGANSVALPMKFGTVWKNRMWGADGSVGSRLRFTQVFQHVWPDTFYVDIPFERGEGLAAMVALGDILIVFGATKFYLIIGQTSLDFEVRPALGTQTGAFGFRAVDVVEASVVHAGGPGVYIYNGASEQLLTYPIQPAWIAMLQAGVSTATEIAALQIAHHKLQKELRVAVPFVQQTGARGEWILDLNRTNSPIAPTEVANQQAWFATDRTIGGYIQWDGNEPIPSNQGRIFSWSPSTVQLFEERTGTSANGSDITMVYQGYMLPVGIQQGRFIDTYLEYKPDVATSFAATLVVDGVTFGPQSLSITPVSSGGIYGSGKYGTATYGGGLVRAMVPIMWPLGAEGHAGQLRFTYVGQGSPKFYTYAHNVVVEPFPRGF